MQEYKEKTTKIFSIVIIGLTTSGRKAWQEEDETRTYTSIVLIHQEQSCTSELFKAIPDAISLILLCRKCIYSEQLLPVHSSCRMCNLHSIINSGMIPGGQILSNRQTVFFLLVDPMDKNHNDPDTIDLNEPRHAQYMRKAWK